MLKLFCLATMVEFHWLSATSFPNLGLSPALRGEEGFEMIEEESNTGLDVESTAALTG